MSLVAVKDVQKAIVSLYNGSGSKRREGQVIAAHGGPLPICIHIEHFRNAAGRLYPVPFAQRAGIVEAFRADARVLREWLGIAPV